MVGRVGRNQKPGLAIMYPEENQKGGSNCVEDLIRLKEQTDNQMMDAMKCTQVCLRIALVLDNT